MGTLASSFALIFLAELGDKSMLLVLAVATRARTTVLLSAVALSAALIMGAAALVGATAGEILPRRLAEAASALLFIAVGAWTVRASLGGAEDDEGAAHGHALPAFLRRARGVDARWAPLLLGAALVAGLTVAELGDKTQLATISLAGAEPGRAVLIWAGAAAGMTAADALAIVAGARLARLLPGRLVERGAGVLFIVVGLLLAALAAL